MSPAPEALVGFGTVVRMHGEAVTLTPTPGPAVSLPRGTLAVADPWFTPGLPELQQISIAQGEQPTVLSTVAMPREKHPEPVAMSCAAAIGRVEEVSSWQPLVQGERHYHLDSDSALGAFYDITDTAVLRPLFEDDLHMQGVYNRALAERVVAMEAGGRVAAVVFLCPDGSGLYPVYAGFDKDRRPIAVLVDLRLLDDAG
jgi:hypothetical protein